MKYYTYKLKFVSPIHIGNGRLSTTDIAINADTIFSAMCIQLYKMYGENHIENFVKQIKENKLVISDAMPYYKDIYYIRKPILPSFCENSTKGVEEGPEEIIKKLDNNKKMKKLDFIKMSDVDKFINDNNAYIDEYNKEEKQNFANKQIRTMSSSVDEEKMETGDMMPFRVGTYIFNDKCGLYIIVGFSEDNDTMKDTFEKVLKMVGHIGVGGKRSSGYGKYEISKYEEYKGGLLCNNKANTNNKNSRYIALSICMPKKDELKNIEGTGYKLIKRGGFIESSRYSKKSVKKNDIYMFESGSMFKETFSGDVFIVNKGKHNVYKYAKPLFLEVTLNAK